MPHSVFTELSWRKTKSTHKSTSSGPLWDGEAHLDILSKPKIQPSTLEDLNGFIERLMNPAASHLATGRRLYELYKVEGFYRQNERGAKKLKEWIVSGRGPFS